MVQLFSIAGRWYPGQKVTFNKYELNQILSIYGAYVSKGEWRDYALDSTHNTATFSIFHNSNEKPSFIIEKAQSKNLKRQAKFTIYNSEKTLKTGDTILEVLQIFNNKKTNNKKGEHDA